MVDVNPPDPLSSIPGPPPKENEKPSKSKDTPVSAPASDKPSKSKKDDGDITKIREKHAQERASQTYVVPS